MKRRLLPWGLAVLAVALMLLAGCGRQETFRRNDALYENASGNFRVFERNDVTVFWRAHVIANLFGEHHIPRSYGVFHRAGWDFVGNEDEQTEENRYRDDQRHHDDDAYEGTRGTSRSRCFCVFAKIHRSACFFLR